MNKSHFMDRWGCLLRGTLGLFSASSAASASGHLPIRRTATRWLISSWSPRRSVKESIIYPTDKARHSHGELRGASARVCAPVLPRRRARVTGRNLIHRAPSVTWSTGEGTMTAFKTRFYELITRRFQAHGRMLHLKKRRTKGLKKI